MIELDTEHEDVVHKVKRLRGELWDAYGQSRLKELGLRMQAEGEGRFQIRRVDAPIFDATDWDSSEEISAESLSLAGEEFKLFADYLQKISVSSHGRWSRLRSSFSVAHDISSSTKSAMTGWKVFLKTAEQQYSLSATRWTDEKNQRRCDLVDKEIAGTITTAERDELDQLQNEMLAERRRVAPLPLEGLRELHQKLLERSRRQTD